MASDPNQPFLIPDNPEEILRMNHSELKQLVQSCRNRIIEVTSKVGGHLASSLGTVELTVAMYHVFDPEKNVFIWDVGHQAYTHKILTGRNHGFDRIGQRGGVAKFLRREESKYDHFGAGHASTSISAALGFAVGFQNQNLPGRVIAVIGDGAMTGGLSFEAMNHTGHLDMDLTVILNDNVMSIDPNVGALSKTFNRIQTSAIYNKYRERISNLADSKNLSKFVKTSLKRMDHSFMEFLSPAPWFEKLGFRYFGPVEGHNLKEVVQILRQTASIKGPILIHLNTQKGKGYEFAEENALKYHGVTPFVPQSGEFLPKSGSGKSYTSIWSETFEEIFRKDPKVTATSAAMIGSVGLKKLFEEAPDRIFDTGIAEAHAVTFNAGMAAKGLKPFVSIYSTFLQRALDNIIHDVALQNLPVRFVLDRAGYVGADGATHHGSFDLTYMRMIPGMVVMAPKDGKELRDMLYCMYRHDSSPSAIRFPRGNTEVFPDAEVDPVREIAVGESELIQEGEDILICAVGSMVERAQQVAKTLEEAMNIRPTLINARFIKPLDEKVILARASRAKLLVTMEENALKGGFGSGVAELLAENCIWLPCKQFGMPDQFIEYGTPEEQLRDAGLLPEQMAEEILAIWKTKIASNSPE